MSGAGGEDLGNGGNSEGGLGGSGAVASGAGGAGGAGGGGETMQWLAFSDTNGVFAYDSSLFPALTSTQLADTPSYRFLLWSPDGSHLLYDDGTNVWAREMTQAVPGEANFLTAIPSFPPIDIASVKRMGWSADSRSIGMVDGPELVVFDPLESPPILHQVTDAILAWSWAPGGNLLAYADAGGTFVVEVVDGQPGSPVEIAPVPLTYSGILNRTAWSPDGSRLLEPESEQLLLHDFSGSPPTVTTLMDLAGAGGGGNQPEFGFGFELPFDASGNRVSFVPDEGKTYPDIYYVGLDGTPPATPTTIYDSPPADGFYAAQNLWSSDSTWLFYSITEQASGDATYFVTDLSGAQPGTPVELPFPELDQFTWIRSNRLLAYGPLNLSLHLIEFTNNGSSDTPLYESLDEYVLSYALNPVTDVLGITTLEHIRFADLAAPEDTPTLISFQTNSSNDAVSTPVWSPDGQLVLVISSNSGNYKFNLLKVVGKEASSPIKLGERSALPVLAAWQPAP